MTVRELGTCFGFSVRSSLPLEYLRAGNGEALEIATLPEIGPRTDERVLLEWRSRTEPPFHVRLYSDGRGYRLWIADEGCYSIEPEVPRVTIPEKDGLQREERLWGIPASLCFLHRGDLAVRAAAVEVDGGAVLLAAPRTSGKSTLAAAFLRAGYRVLGDDVSCVRPYTHEAATVIPGPALLRLRRDVVERVDVPCAYRVGEDAGHVHLALDPAMRGDCQPVPVRAVMLLRPDESDLSLERVPVRGAIPDLWALSLRLPTDEDRSRCFAGVADVAKAVPVWNLTFPRRLGAMASAVERIVARV
jgi:hypothetical protein